MGDRMRLVGAVIVTQDPSGTVIPSGEVAFDRRGVISYVGPARGPAGPGDADLAGHILMPGLVNAHTHSAMTLLRGLCDDAALASWLEVVQSVEQRMTLDDIAAGLQLALVEMIRSGTTTFADMYHWDGRLLELVVRSGMRVCAAPSVFGAGSAGFPTASTMTARGVLDLTERLADDFAGETRVRLRYGPHAPYTCPPELLSEIAARAQQTGLGIQIHLCETAAEVRQTRERYGRTPIMHADALGLLRVPALVAHSVHPADEEIELLAARDASVSHNPISNLKLGSGVAPVRQMRDAGVRLALGTDGAASNNSLDLFEEIKTGTILQRGVAQNPEEASSADFLAMATSDGARAVGYPEVGVLAPGYWADIIALSTDLPQATPLHSPTAFLAYAARGGDVRHVFIGGDYVLRDGAVTTIDEDAARAAVIDSARRLHPAGE